MTSHNLNRLRHIDEAIDTIASFVHDMSFEDFKRDRKTQFAVTYEIQIIGEALNHIDDDFRGMHLDLPHEQIIGMRNVIVHEYFGVNLRRIWNTVQKNLPQLKDQVAKAIRKLESEP